MPKNRVRYGLKNVHWAEATQNEDGTITFGQPKAWPGAVHLELEAQGDPAEFYADDMTYFNAPTNNGYDGTLETALIPDEFRQSALGEKVVSGVQVENGDAKDQKHFALLFEFEGDKRNIRHIIYWCQASRPTEEGSTVEDQIEVQTTELEFQARKRPDTGDVKARCTDDAPDNIYDSWYDTVFGADTTISATGVSITGDDSVDAGADLQLTAAVTPSDASDKSVKWASSDPDIATVDGNGKVHGVAAGQAVIICYLQSDPTKQAVKIVTVNAAG